MKYPYDTSYFPPAPSIEIRLGVPEHALVVGPLRALVDTGADVSIVPFRYIQPLRVQVDDRKYLRSQFGERVKVDVYLLDLEVAEMRLPLIEIIADERGEKVILGRNVLNKLTMTLHGPKQALEVSQ